MVVDELPLVGWLSVQSVPCALLHLAPLKAELITRQQPLETPRELQAPLRRLSLATGSESERTPSKGQEDEAVVDYFSAIPSGGSGSTLPAEVLQLAWANASFNDWIAVVHRDQAVSPRREASDDTIMRGDTPPGINGQQQQHGTAPVDFALLSLRDQEELLSFILDTVEVVEEPRPTNTSTPLVQLHSQAFSATVLAPYVVLTAVPTLPPTPSIPSTEATPTRTFERHAEPLVITSTARPSPAFSFDLDTPPNVDSYLAALSSTKLGRLIRDFNWANSLLGPISSWVPELKTMVTSILASPYRECILYGPHRVMIYNDEYVGAAGGKHPSLLGRPAAEGWGEIWDDLEPIAVRVMNGETVSFVDQLLPMKREGHVEETYHTFSYAPFCDRTGRVLGIRNFSMETTAAVIAARRLSTVRDLIQTTSMARTVSDFSDFALQSIASNAYDLPFTLLYTVEPVTPKPSLREIRSGIEERLRLGVQVTCCGSLGVPVDHPFYVSEAIIDLSPPMSRHSSASGSGSTATAMADDGDVGRLAWSWPFEEACLRREPVFVEDLGVLPQSLEKRGWEETPRHAVVIPIMVDAANAFPQAILVLGVNARSEYDDLHATFFNLLARHIAVGLFAVMTAEMDAKRADDLVRLDKAKSSFFSNVSHELRTPLTLILGPLEDVLNGKEKLLREQHEKLVIVQRHGNRLLNMVNKLLDFSSLEGGRLLVKFRPVKLGAVTRDLATLFRDAVERNGLQFIVECDDDPPDCLPMYIAMDLWEKVIYNIVGNAVKYCQQGSIEVTLRSTIAEAVLAVRDTGVGIPAEDLSRIFERFHRVDGTSRTTSGTGIGLAFTLEVVKTLGGQLEVESQPGQGSTFIVRLPRGFVHLPMAQVYHDAEPETSVPVPIGRSLAMIDEAATWRQLEALESMSTASSHGADTDSNANSGGHSSSNEDFADSAQLLNLSNRTVMVCEDSPDLRSYIASILAKSYTVVQMPDGQAALDYALRHPPSLIVTDQMMPRLTGDELVAALRAEPKTALIPIIMISAQAGTEARAGALERGLDDYLAKPFQARELLARVNVHLQLGLMRAELEKRVLERTRALLESEAQNRSLADKYSTLSSVSPVGILQADEEGNAVYVNPRFLSLTGCNEWDVTNWRDTVWDEDRPRLDAFYTSALHAAHDAELGYESLEVRFKDREDAWGQIDIRSFQDVGGKSATIVVVTDLTRAKKAEELHVRTVEARRVEAEDHRRQSEQFLDLTSHELRNPLSGVWQNAELLATSLKHISTLFDDLALGKPLGTDVLKATRQEMQENLDSVESVLICTAHQGRIADDILNVSKLNMGLLSVVPVPFDLTARMTEVLRMFETESNQKEIQLRLAVGESIQQLQAQFIVADPSRLAQILLNFLSNSIKYTTDAPRRKIVVHLNAFPKPGPLPPNAMRVSEPPDLDLEPGRVWVAVGCEDSGKGLTAEEMRKLFARFAQANPKSDQYGGSGLGLYVSKKLVELHHGFIEVESTPGQGSVFRFFIPASIAEQSATSPPLSTPPPLSLAPRSKRSAPLRPAYERTYSSKNAKVSGSPVPKHILVVEDNLINQKVLTRQLKLSGYVVSVAGNGREGLDLLLAERTKDPNPTPIAAVLMDIEMPVMGGLEAIKLLREMEQTGEVPKRYPVIAVTGNARQAQLDLCFAAGFDNTAVKPYVLADLVQMLKRYTGEGPLPLP